MTGPALRWLLDVLSEHRVPLGIFAHSEMCLALNVHEPPGGSVVLPNTLAAAWEDGLLEFSIEPRNALELRAWLQAEAEERADRSRRPNRGPYPSPIYIGLTPAGGALWASLFEPDWTRFVNVWWALEHSVFEVPEGMAGRTLEGLDRGLLDDVVSKAGTLLGAEVVADWRPAYWRPGRPAHRVFMVVAEPSERLELPIWRRPRFLGIDLTPPRQLASDPNWHAYDVDVSIVAGSRILRVYLGADVLQFHLICRGRRVILDIVGSREVLHAREVDHTATLERMVTEGGGCTLTIVWNQGDDRAVERQVLHLPNTSAIWWSRSRRTG